MIKSLRESYVTLLTLMQKGVLNLMAVDPNQVEPKNLRMGLNAALTDQMALIHLLIAKGVITEEEYMNALVIQMGEVVDSQLQILTEKGVLEGRENDGEQGVEGA